MWYTIILLSIALAVSVGFWVKADRMAAHYRREREAEEQEWGDMVQRENAGKCAAMDIAQSYKSDLATTRRQLAAARGQITKLRRKYGETE